MVESKEGDLEQRKGEAMKERAACANLLSGRAVAEAAWGSGDAHVQLNLHTSTEAVGFRGPRCSVLDPWLRREALQKNTLP